MIEWIKGAKIRDYESLLEGYCVEKNCIVSVLNAGNIMKVMRSYVRLYSEYHFFFFLEIPCNMQEEEKLHLTDGKLHKKIYYLDNIWASEVLHYLELFGEILVNDGMIAFGLGNHESEIGKYKYNMVRVFSGNLKKLKEIFDENGIVEKDDLRTPWDIIGPDNPGKSSAFTDDEGKSIYDVIEALKEAGLYQAEIRAE